MRTLFIILLFSNALYSQKVIRQSTVIGLEDSLATKVRKTDSTTIFQTKYRGDTARNNVYPAIAAKGSVTSVSVTTANGVSGSVATATSTPAISLTLGAITPTTVNGNTFTTGSSTYTGTAAQTYTFPDTSALIGIIPKTSSVTGTDDTTTLTVVQTAAGLSVWARANKRYKAIVTLHTACDNTGGILFGLSGPAGSAILSGEWTGNGGAATGVLGSRSTSMGNVIAAAFNPRNGAGWARFTGYFTTSATAGNVNIIFRSATLGQKSTINIGSTIELTEVN